MNKFSLFLLTSSLLLAACAEEPTVKVDDSTVLKVQKYNQVMQSGKNLVDPVHGAQARFAYGAVSGVGQTKANGVSFLHTFSDGTSVLTVNVNILPAPKGSQYSVQLSGSSSLPAMNVGTLESILGDARHSIEFATKTDVKSFTAVSVYLGKDLAAQGALKEVAL